VIVQSVYNYAYGFAITDNLGNIVYSDNTTETSFDRSENSVPSTTDVLYVFFK